jgi:hypothetical protein
VTGDRFTAATVAVLRERCACGAEIETDEQDCLEIVQEWRINHICPDKLDEDFAPIGGTAQVEQAPDHTVPDMHIGFRGDW